MTRTTRTCISCLWHLSDWDDDGLICQNDRSPLFNSVVEVWDSCIEFERYEDGAKETETAESDT